MSQTTDRLQRVPAHPGRGRHLPRLRVAQEARERQLPACARALRARPPEERVRGPCSVSRVCVNLSICLSLFIYLCISIYLSMHIHLSVYLYQSMYVCIYHIYMYKYLYIGMPFAPAPPQKCAEGKLTCYIDVLLSIYLYLSIYIFISIYLYIHLSIAAAPPENEPAGPAGCQGFA